MLRIIFILALGFVLIYPSSAQTLGLASANKYYEDKYKEFEKRIAVLIQQADDCITEENKVLSGEQSDLSSCIQFQKQNIKSFLTEMEDVELSEKEAIKTAAITEPNNHYYDTSTHELLELDSMVLIFTSKSKEIIQKRSQIKEKLEQ